jgi:4'-phosphopantetheinyl transferase
VLSCAGVGLDPDPGAGALEFRPPPGQEWPLRGGDVHLWRARLAPSPARVAALQPLLSGEEREQAGRFHAARHRDAYTVAHALLRLVLARHLGADPAGLRFERGPRGKPALAGAPGLAFNLSHAGDLALCAVTARGPVGVDVEQVRAGFDEVWERYFTPLEVAALRAAAPGLRDEAFFRYWTLKEAYIKATGDGLSLPLDRFEIVPAPGSGEALVRATGGEPLPFELRSFRPAPGYAGAVAVSGRLGAVHAWDADALAVK